MVPYYRQKLWIPYSAAIFGVVLSCFLWLLSWREFQHDISFYNTLELHFPWIILGLGVCFSILIATLIYLSQLAHYRTSLAEQEQEALKKEVIEAEEAKQKLEVALLQGQKLQAIGTLAGGIAHDFNNILYAIIGYVGMAREDVEKDSLTYKNLGKVLEATQKGQELIARILAFSRRQHHQFDSIYLKDTIEAALGLLQPTIPASVMMDFQAEDNPMILGNQTQIHQVLVNIINNAVDAMDGEGKITLRLSIIDANDPLLKQIPKILKQNYCKIDIRDTGHGMDQPTMERIFEPFFTTKEVGKGTGLGLSIVHSIIKEHQGEISVRSQLGHGTIFTILLPEQTS